jgi:RHS repeat-associated protein
MDNRNRHGKYILVTIVTILLILSITGFVKAQDTADLTNPSVYSVPTVGCSVNTGAASYKIPIEVPPGRKGMQPNISLIYNSYTNNGWIGEGWSLDIGYIQRATKDGLTYSGNDFIASINGSSSELVSRSSAWGADYYGAKIEGGFTKYKYSASTGWEATTKDGTKYYFGQTSATRQTVPSDTTKVFMWCLDKILDTNGNYMIINYDRLSGTNEIYPSTITYTSPSATKSVVFTRQTAVRSDQVSSYKTNFLVKTTQLLSTITTKVGAQIVRQYVLSYENPNPINGRSRLSKIQINGYKSDGTLDTNTINPIEFTYYDGGNNTFENGQTTYVNNIPSYHFLYGDINGDGKTDFIKTFLRWKTGETKTRAYAIPFLSNGDGTFTQKPLKELAAIQNSFCFYVNLADVNGDGLADMISNDESGGTKAYTYLSNGDGTFANAIITNGPGATFETLMLVDVDRDGMADLIRHDTDTGKIYSCLSNGDGTFQSSGYGTNSGPGGEYPGFVYFLDVTGDGYPDLIKRVVAANYFYSGILYVYKNNGNGTFASSYTTQYITDGTVNLLFADINGDGLVDIIETDNWDGNVYTWLAKGDGSFASKQTTNLGGVFRVDGVSDVNGDGLADILIYDANSGTYISISKGDGTFYPRTSIEAYGALVDFNGDGLTDILSRGGDNCVCLHLAKCDSTVGEGPVDTLKTIINENGGTTSLTYGKSSDYPDNYCPFRVLPLSKITTNDGNGVVAESIFDYAGATYDFESREFWGFDTVILTNPDDSIMTTNYYQDENKKGRPFQILIEDPNGTDLKKTTYAWSTYASFTSTNFVYLANKNTVNYDTGTQTREVYTHDNTNGNLLTTVLSDQTPGTTAETVTTTNIYINKGTWVWRLESETITGSGVSNGRVRKTKYTYDSYGNMLTKTYCLGQSSETGPYEQYTPDSYGNTTTFIDGNGYSTTYSYDSTTSFTFPVTITYPSTNGVSHVETKTWDSRYGKELTKTDQNNNTITLTYDGYGRTSTISYPDGGGVIYTYYDTASPRYVRKQVKESSSSYVTSYEYYDGFGRTIKNQSVGESSKTILTVDTYDVMGRESKTQGPYFSGASVIPYVQTIYDYLGRPITVQTFNDSGSTATTGYTYSGFSTTTTDPDGNIKIETKDYLGRVVKVQEDTGGGTTNYTYNAAGDLLSVVDNNNNTTSMAYDTLGRKKTMTDPDMGYWQYTSYDGNGNLLTQIDAKIQTITFTYDKLNRVLTKTYSTSDPSVTYAYDSGTNGKGLLYSVTNSNATTVNDSYDAMGRVKSVTKTITGDSSSRNTLYTYDLSGKVLTTTYPGGYIVTNSYYAGANLLYRVTGSDSVIYAAISNYQPAGKIGTMVQGNGSTTTYTYNDYTTRLAGISTVSAGSTVQNRSFTYTDAGDISRIVDSTAGVTYNYTYDELHRLHTETNNGGYGALTMGYYDALGNITSKTVGSSTLTYAYNNSTHKHAVSAINGYTFSYDANGNMTSGYDFTTPSSPVARTMTWNADNMPSTITSGSTTATFLYDGTGTRAKKTVGSTTTYYIGDHYERKGGVAYKYIFAGNLRVAQIAGSTVSYFHKDHLGSSSVMTNSSGTQIESTNYEPFGGMRAHSGTTTSGYKFTDQELDAENGLYNYDARLYDPVIGRFISPDTIVPDEYNPQSLNRYAYCLNNPLRYTDPSGHYADDYEYTLEEIEAAAEALQQAQALQQNIYFTDEFTLEEIQNTADILLGSNGGDDINKIANTWDPITNSRILELDPRIQDEATDFINVAENKGICIRITSGYRSIADQNALYAKGRNGDTSAIVTNAQGGQSNHNWGLALDVVPIGDNGTGKANWNADWGAIGVLGKSVGFSWGGDFKSFIDRPHFELVWPNLELH